MKTKLLLLSFFLLAVTQNGYSQPYAPFLNNSTWNLTVYSFIGATRHNVNPAVDVVIGAYTYKKYNDPIFGDDVYLREDVAAKKVYTLRNNVDILLYDFSLPVGGTFVTSFAGAFTVMSITNVNVGGGIRRSFRLDNGFAGFTWIEGVGSPEHPLKADYELPSDPAILISCSAQNGIVIYNQGTVNGGTPTDCTMLGIDQNQLASTISFSPNPFNSALQIRSEISLENVSLKLFNSLGQLVKEVQSLSGQDYTLNRDNLNSGLFFIQLLQGNKVISYKKIFIQD
jgi:hypothetical protein